MMSSDRRARNSIKNSLLGIPFYIDVLTRAQIKKIDHISNVHFGSKISCWAKIRCFEREYDMNNYFCINVYVELIAYFRVMVWNIKVQIIFMVFMIIY